ncbi:hypothetical protein G6016_12490 [Dietzia aerolata]|uniref:Nucleotide exchange factor GrpE n=1 Tax=Dietzia aerolata TaxID=595984 RepID=A0ABV5JSA8_9ACTN|nr:hypothetical protein [Dietzia aerolata]MBB0969759.1 hypothetical protein [Dietzia aerolata]
MTDQTTTEATEVDDQTTDTPTEDQPQATENRNAEAARYRRQLRAAESERDALAETVTALRRAAVEDRVKAQKVPTEGFWASGVQLEDLLDEAGGIDAQKVTAAADHAVETLGLQRVGVHMQPVPSEGRTTNPSGSQGWKAAFAPK